MRTEPTVPAAALAAIREPFLAAGAEPVDAPILQPLGLLLELAGEAMRARLFVVQAEGGEELCLRPDFTVPVVRQHLESGQAAGRYLYEGRAFRASDHPDRPQEFRQIGMERFDPAGPPDPDADAEIVALAWRAAAAGGRDDLTLQLGDVALFAAFVDGLGLAEPLAARLKRAASRPRLLQAELARAGAQGETSEGGRLADLLTGLSPSDAAALLEEVWALAGVEPVGGRGPAEIAQRLIRRADAQRAPALSVAQAQAVRDFLQIADAPHDAFAAIRQAGQGQELAAALEAWEQRLARLADTAPAARIQFAAAPGHAFDYYDGLTFQVRSAALGAERPVAVGGRYDSLPGRLGAKGSGRAIGCMVRPWRAFVGGEA